MPLKYVQFIFTFSLTFAPQKFNFKLFAEIDT